MTEKCAQTNVGALQWFVDKSSNAVYISACISMHVIQYSLVYDVLRQTLRNAHSVSAVKFCGWWNVHAKMSKKNMMVSSSIAYHFQRWITAAIDERILPKWEGWTFFETICRFQANVSIAPCACFNSRNFAISWAAATSPIVTEILGTREIGTTKSELMLDLTTIRLHVASVPLFMVSVGNVHF